MQTTVWLLRFGWLTKWPSVLPGVSRERQKGAAIRVTNIAHYQVGASRGRAGPSKYAFISQPQRDSGPVRLRHRRWWLFATLASNPLARPVDRAERWVVSIVLAIAIGAVPVSIDFSQTIEASEAAAIKTAKATRHSVEAVALSASETRSQGSTSTNWAHLQWFDRSATRDRTVEVPHAMKAGDRTPVWVNDSGNLTAPPRNEADAVAGGIGAGVMLWLVTAALAAWGLSMMRRFLDHLRYRGWDRDLQLLVGNGGGSTAHNT
jgi:hypothetical protein